MLIWYLLKIDIYFSDETQLIQIYKDSLHKADVAIMPIWAYDPWINSHCNPEQALSMALDLWAKYFIPIHCETFVLGKEWVDTPRKILNQLIQYRDEISLWSQTIWDTFIIR